MDVRDKIEEALRQALQCEYIRLEDENGITGFAVSARFENRSSLDRQETIEDVLNKALSPEERRRVLMIAALTPTEYSAVGAKIRVHKVKSVANGVEVLLHGGLSDAEYVRGALNNLKGVKTSEPKQSPGATGTLTYFRAVGSKENPLTKGKAIGTLKNDPYIEVAPNV